MCEIGDELTCKVFYKNFLLGFFFFLAAPLFPNSKINQNEILPHKASPIKIEKNETKMSKKLTENVCKKPKTPCQNNGTCIWNEDFETYYCECAPSFTNDNCTELIGFYF